MWYTPLVAGMLAASVQLGSPAAPREPPAVPTERLELFVVTTDRLDRITMTATFSFLGARTRDSLWFTYPGVESPDGFTRLELNGRRIDRSRLHGADVRGERRFVLDRALGVHRGLNRLTVEATLENVAPTYTHWGAWHPYFGSRARPVPIALEVRTAGDHQVVASGRRVSDTVTNGHRVARWVSHVPQGWAFLSIGQYQSRLIAETPVRLIASWPTSHTDFDPKAISRTPIEILGFYGSRFGKADIDALGVLEIADSAVTNFSIDGLVVISRGSYRAATENPAYLQALLAHELAHWWWGDVIAPIGPGLDWLTEGFAEYSRVLYERHARTPLLPWTHRNLVALREAHSGGAESITSAPASPARDAMIRHKGAHILYMLEQELGGPAALQSVLHKFVERQHGRPTSVRDFIAVVNEASGVRYDWFFRQWLDRPTGPEIRLDSVALKLDSAGPRVHVVVEQAEPAYRLSLPIQLTYDDGSRETRVVTIQHRQTSVDLPVSRAPRHLEVDPDGAVFKWFSAEAMAVSFADATGMLANGACVSMPAPSDSVLRRHVDALLERRRHAPSSADAACPIHVVTGTAAARYREANLVSTPPPGRDTVSAFIHRRPEAGARIVIGFEGALQTGIPDLALPEAPVSYIALRDGRVIAAHSTGLPRIAAPIPGRR